MDGAEVGHICAVAVVVRKTDVDGKWCQPVAAAADGEHRAPTRNCTKEQSPHTVIEVPAIDGVRASRAHAER